MIDRVMLTLDLVVGVSFAKSNSLCHNNRLYLKPLNATSTSSLARTTETVMFSINVCSKMTKMLYVGKCFFSLPSDIYT